MRRYGLVVGVQTPDATVAREISEHLTKAYPNVTVSVVAGGASSVAFEWDDGVVVVDTRGFGDE